MRNRMMNFLNRHHLLAFLTICFSFSAHAVDMQNLRGQRYCEVLLGADRWIPRNVEVYNTIGLNQCPKELWDKLTPEQIKKDTGATFVRLNGPRHWVIDGIKNSKLINPKQREFGGIAMRTAGIL